MVFKANFEPKDARVIPKEEIDEEDEKKRRKRTGTQALVEFLNTTSPEEFQKPMYKRSSFFARKRKSQPVKNYIELISSPFRKQTMLPRRTSCYSSSSTTAVRHMLMASSIEDEKSTIESVDERRIEQGLRQRLAQYGPQRPGEVVARALTGEHVAALETMINHGQQAQEEGRRRGLRSVQVQTMPYESTMPLLSPTGSTMDLVHHDLQERYEQAQQELQQERLLRQKLQATLDEVTDQFEVLSGLAYKKLREVWEEKVRWENACIQVKEKCWQDHQQQILGSARLSISSHNSGRLHPQENNSITSKS
ncbi:hypothetical protein BY458DRAFT_429245 [Sporodiniella umbellata]|nr:hypothetical protein BY458DRAFT_429245 [Sporodiniella umbellata]